MPISYEGKDYEFGDLVEHIKKSKPEIKSPGGYVKKIEEAEHKARLAAYSMCKDCSYKPANEADLRSHSEQTGHTIMSKGARIASLLIAASDYKGEEEKVKEKKREEEANPTFKKGKEEDDRIDPKTGKPKAAFTLLEKGEYGVGKKYKGASHPFNKMASLYKLQILSRVKGASYVPRDADPQYENLDLESRQGIDNLFGKERVNIIAAKLASMSFSGSASADTKKTGADVEKEKEKIPKGTTNPFDFLGAKIREAVMSDFVYSQVNLSTNKEGDKGEKKNNQLGAPVTVTEPKKDPQEFSGGLSGKKKADGESYYNSLGEDSKKT